MGKRQVWRWGVSHLADEMGRRRAKGVGVARMVARGGPPEHSAAPRLEISASSSARVHVL